MVFFNAFSAYLATDVTATGEYLPVSETFIITSAVLCVFLLLSPLFVSWAISRSYPTLKIVWPFWLAMITFGEIVIVGLIIGSFPLELAAIIFGVPYLIASYFEDSLVVKLHGITAEKKHIYFEHLLITANIDDARNQLRNLVVAKNLRLSDIVEGDPQNGFLFSIKEGNKFCKIKLIKSNGIATTSELKVVYYQKGRYALTSTPDFLEWATEKSCVLQGVFNQPTRQPHYEVKPIGALTNEAQDSFIDNVVADMQQGYFIKFRTFSMQDRLKIIAFIALIGITLWLVLIGEPIEALAAAVFEVIIAIDEVLNISKKRQSS